jgi:glycosyltransferase involved in cell wall biosynthesis
MFSINPLFPDRVMGGAPKHLQHIAVYLGRAGHDVTVLCTRADHEVDAFTWGDCVTVRPILPFHQPFPQPYAVPAYDMARILQIVGDYLAQADRFYMHDGEFLFPYAYRAVPTVVSLRDNVYPETLLGSYLFQGDRLILISEFSRRYFLATAGRFFPDLAARTEVIHNGIDWTLFQPQTPGRILDLIPASPDRPILLHPHRPEESKGIRQTIAVVDKLVHEHGIHDLLALAPRWLDVQLTSDLRDFYDSILQDIASRGLKDNFLFHDWVPQALMPEYYSLGRVTVSLGHFVESFGNAVYESMGCGTPSIVARIATHRELMPDHLIDKVDYGDVDEAARIAAEIIRSGRGVSDESMAYLHTHYGVERQLAAYADAILGATKRDALAYRHLPVDSSTRYGLAPWTYVSERGIYHDFLGNYYQLPALVRLSDTMLEGFTREQMLAGGMSEDECRSCVADGYVIPVID